MIMHTDKTKSGKQIIIDYNQFGLGKRYKVKIGNDFKSMVFFDTYGEAMNYVNKLKTGGMH